MADGKDKARIEQTKDEIEGRALFVMRSFLAGQAAFVIKVTPEGFEARIRTDEAYVGQR